MNFIESVSEKLREKGKNRGYPTILTQLIIRGISNKIELLCRFQNMTQAPLLSARNKVSSESVGWSVRVNG